MAIYSSVRELIGATPMVVLNNMTENARVIAKLEFRNPGGSVKDRVALNMLKKMKPQPLPRIIAGCAFAVMLTVNFLSLKFSSISPLFPGRSCGILFITDEFCEEPI